LHSNFKHTKNVLLFLFGTSTFLKWPQNQKSDVRKEKNKLNLSHMSSQNLLVFQHVKGLKQNFRSENMLYWDQVWKITQDICSVEFDKKMTNTRCRRMLLHVTTATRIISVSCMPQNLSPTILFNKPFEFCWFSIFWR